MLVPARQFDDLSNFGLSDFKSIDAANPDSMAVDMEHDLDRFLPRLGKEPLQDMHDELHGRVVVVQDEHLIERRLLRLGPRSGDDSRADPSAIAIRVAAAIAAPGGAGASRCRTAIQISNAHR